MTDLAVYAGLFIATFAAATEAALVGLTIAGYSPWLLVFVASVGNVLGAALNWALGRGIEQFRDRSWFPLNAASLDRAKNFYSRYGSWSLLLSWAPVIGDPLTFIAGVMRESLIRFILLVALAKTGRYVVLVLGTTQFT